MKWAYAIGPRMKIAGFLGIIFVMVFCKNMMERQNATNLGSTFSSFYEDRLLVESYIYTISDHLNQKQRLMDQYMDGDGVSAGRFQEEMTHHNTAIQALVASYAKTKFTPSETETFNAFRRQYAQLLTQETVLVNKGFHMNLSSTDVLADYQAIELQLRKLSAIQVEEAKKLNDHSKGIIAGSVILTTLEMALLVGIGIVIQTLIFTTNTLMVKTGNPSLN